MARTKASVGAKVSSGKSSKARCSVAPPVHNSSGGSGERSSGRHSGGNSVCPRETPKWQRPITNFFISKETRDDRQSDSEEIEDTSNGDINEKATSSKSKRNIIESDDEETSAQVENSNVEENPLEKPVNTELDETLELEPLDGEECHKIEEYYSKNGKGKGRGKKSKDKENVDKNIENRNSVKRDLEDITFGEESEHARKKVKLG